MKKLKLSLFALLFSIALPASFAHASYFSSYADFYTVGSNGSTIAQTTFAPNQDPYLYVEIANPPVTLTNVDLTFTAESNGGNIYSTATFSNQNSLWIPLSGLLNVHGSWFIDGVTYTPNNGQIEGYQGTTGINVAPEPMGMLLFLLGGSIMAIYLIRRKKILAV